MSGVPSDGRVIDQTRQAVNALAAKREARREAMAHRKAERAAEERRNVAQGNPGDVDFIGLVKQWRASGAAEKESHGSQGHSKICISVRKRPVSDKERAKKVREKTREGRMARRVAASSAVTQRCAAPQLRVDPRPPPALNSGGPSFIQVTSSRQVHPSHEIIFVVSRLSVPCRETSTFRPR